MQNKVLEAVAAGLPTVVTPAVFDGLPEAVRPACRVAQGPQAFADQIRDLLCLSEQDRRVLATTADVGALAWDNALRPLREILAARSTSGSLP